MMNMKDMLPKDEAELSKKPVYRFLKYPAGESPPTAPRAQQSSRVSRPPAAGPGSSQSQDPCGLADRKDIVPLTSTNFSDFLAKSDVAMVLFHEGITLNMNQKFTMYIIAQSSTRQNAALGTVDCDKERAFCDNQRLTTLPSLRVYSRGNITATYPSSPIDSTNASNLQGQTPPPSGKCCK